MTINRQKFFAHHPPTGANLTQQQVNGTNAILDAWEESGLKDLHWLSYMLATAWHETAHTMQPIEEYGRGAGHPYGQPAANGKRYFGRGLVQLTWERNYSAMAALTGTDLVNHPELALQPAIAAKIMFEGMTRGTFTGKKLSTYFNAFKTDWTNARRIINGTDRAALIAGYALRYYAAIQAAQDGVSPAPAVTDDKTEIKTWQAALNSLGYANPLLAVDGDIGPATTAAIKKFQQANPPLVIDGVFGPASIAVMEKLLSDKEQSK